MTKQRRILGWAAFVGSFVACLPSACCFAYFAVSSITASSISPEMLKSFSGSGDAPGPEFYRALVLPTTFAALLALAVGIVCLAWGLRTVTKARAHKASPPAQKV